MDKNLLIKYFSIPSRKIGKRATRFDKLASRAQKLGYSLERNGKADYRLDDNHGMEEQCANLDEVECSIITVEQMGKLATVETF